MRAMVHIELADQTDFDGWRSAARRLAAADAEPSDVRWTVRGEQDGGGLFDAGDAPVPATTTKNLKVPRSFVPRLERVLHHRDPERFSFMYRMLLRVAGEPNLMKIASDGDVQRFEAMEKSIRRDAHKMHAFVRFRRIGIDGDERFVAWFEPEHYIVEREADFFVRRFTGMKWSILTPWRSIFWDGERLTVARGGRKSDLPDEDAAEDLWRTYFSSIFNPARLKVKAMQAEMPKKYWRNLPEARLIPRLISDAGRTTEEMIARTPTLPAAHHGRLQERYWQPRKDAMAQSESDGKRSDTLDELRERASACRRCPLHEEATQTVFGEGPGDAELVFVGEQPGDQEDISGKPFVGPAGKVFDETLAAVGIDRSHVYVTNAVKHFKFFPRGKRRIHQKPNAGEISACRWWVDEELRLLKPKLAVALGATAASSLLGKAVPVMKIRGRIVKRGDGLAVFVTVHPSYLLRLPDAETAEREKRKFADDMRAVRNLMRAA